MKDFFSKKKNIITFSVILAIIVIIVGVIVGVNINKKKREKARLNTQRTVIAEKGKTKILGKEKEEKEKALEEKKTEQYKRYEELTDKEKKEKEVVPKKYKVNYKAINNIIKEQKEDTKTKIKKKTDTDYEFGIPKKYNLADKIKINVENQGDYNLCWDFAATKSLETNLQLTKKKTYDLSEMHVNYVTSNLLIGDRDINYGGNFSVYEDYLSDSGAVLEKDVEYRDYNRDEYDNFLGMKDVATVTKTVNFPTIFKYDNYLEGELTEDKIETVRNAVKNHIMNYGSVYAEVAMDDYDDNTKTLYSNPSEFSYIDHAISIVGWDDNYSKNNFPAENRPEKDGAYIALNSWGREFGDSGYFYISYEDQNIESAISGVISTSYEDAIELDKINNSVVKDIVLQRLSNTLKENNKKKYVTKLALSRIMDINLENTYIENLKGFDIFENLYYIDIAKTSVSDIKPLASLKQLGYINLSNTNVKDVTPLKDLDLYYIDLSNNSGIKGYEKIKKLCNISLAGCDITDISKLNGLKDLISINLSENTQIDNIDELNENIYELYLSGCNIENIKDIMNLKNLTALDLSYNKLQNINGIENLDNLQYINLSGNKIRDFSNINNISEKYSDDEFVNERVLVVEDAGIKDISIFNGLSNITSLYLAKNDITDLSGFYNNNIYELDLSENKNLSNIQYLKNSENLMALYLEDCDLDDITEVSKISNNMYILDLAKNNITNVDKLNHLDLMALSLEENTGLIGKLSIENLESLNLANTDYNSNNFNFDDCENLVELNLSGINDENLKNILESNSLDNLWTMIIDGSIISKETLNDLINKNIYIIGGDINIIESEEDTINLDNKTLDIKNSAEILDLIKEGVVYRGLYLTGGTLTKDLKTIKLNSDSTRAIIYVKNGYNVEEFKIIIECKVKEDEDENTTTVENETTSKNETTTETKQKGKNYKMVDD